uniref:Uncharacterized protein n=1 Tax=Bracon brevicornis TaxID=1563983 RepID=A0A6V7J627_9HYME
MSVKFVYHYPYGTHLQVPVPPMRPCTPWRPIARPRPYLVPTLARPAPPRLPAPEEVIEKNEEPQLTTNDDQQKPPPVPENQQPPIPEPKAPQDQNRGENVWRDRLRKRKPRTSKNS